MTPDTWHMMGVTILSKCQLPSSNSLGLMMCWRLWGIGLLSESVNQWMPRLFVEQPRLHRVWYNFKGIGVIFQFNFFFNKNPADSITYIYKKKSKTNRDRQNGQKQKDTDRHGQKYTKDFFLKPELKQIEACRNGQKRLAMYRNVQKLTEADRNGRKQTATVRNGQKQSEANTIRPSHKQRFPFFTVFYYLNSLCPCY